MQKSWKSGLILFGEDMIILSLKKENMLVMGDASMHKILEIKRSVELSETKKMMSGGLTRYRQPLDVSINKRFKEEIRRKCNEYCIENTDLKVSRKQIID